jgi:hypothetical protein
MGLLGGLMPHTVTIEAFQAEGASGWKGAASYGTPISYPCRIQYKQRRILAASGREELSSGSLVVEDDIPLDIRDRITISGFSGPTQPPIKTFDKNAGPFGGVAITTIYF